MSSSLVLSVYPGIDLQGRAFEEEGYCVVRGPDPLWGGDIRTFHPPAGVFEGVIGGPPCQRWTRLQFLNPNAGKGLDWVVSEFARVVEEAAPSWYLMEEVVYAPMPIPRGYRCYDVLLADEDVGGVQPRERRFTFGTPDGRMLWVNLHEPSGNGEKRSILSSGPGAHGGGRGEGWEGGRLPGAKKTAVLAGHGPVGRGANWQVNPSLEDACEAMGLPRDFTKEMPFTMSGKRSVIGNGVPMAMGRAIAKAVRRAAP